MQERTEWHRVVFFNKLGEIAGEYLKKGSKVYIEGSIRTRKWQGQDGQDRYTTEIVANEMQMLDGRGDGGGQGGGYTQSSPAQGNQGGYDSQAGGGQPAGAATSHTSHTPCSRSAVPRILRFTMRLGNGLAGEPTGLRICTPAV